MVSSRFKKNMESFLKSMASPLVNIGINPNMVTIMALIVTVIAGSLITNWRNSAWMLPAAGFLLILSGLLDALDGAVARLSLRVTPFGGFLDSVSDRYSDAIILGAVTISGLVQPIYGLAALIGSIMVSYTRSRSEAAGVDMAGVGLAERAERILILSIAIILGYYNPWILDLGVSLLAILTHLTVVQRCLHFSRASRNF
jgi:archaetidylinositol phosphate synthase